MSPVAGLPLVLTTCRGQRLLRLAATCIFAGTFFLSIACKSSPVAGGPDGSASLDAVEPAPIQDSGKSLSGTYLLTSIVDDYAVKNLPDGSQTVFTFDDTGRFKREQRTGGKVTADEAGGYILGTHDELVLYVEQAGGQPLASARAQRYTLHEESGGGLRLTAGGQTMILKKE